ncbi:MAG: hypothetical protein V1781_07695 [Bacteroidota bacterium]
MSECIIVEEWGNNKRKENVLSNKKIILFRAIEIKRIANDRTYKHSTILYYSTNYKD